MAILLWSPNHLITCLCSKMYSFIIPNVLLRNIRSQSPDLSIVTLFSSLQGLIDDLDWFEDQICWEGPNNEETHLWTQTSDQLAWGSQRNSHVCSLESDIDLKSANHARCTYAVPREKKGEESHKDKDGRPISPYFCLILGVEKAYRLKHQTLHHILSTRYLYHSS